ncbi:hypothetical protein [Jannaschia seohaensis]|uniref:Uncharacterized protein n=1 Tax=Jannaschia seohaensis TaxID=475081 RepID=A0A2Y9BW32_9RHOB|nr:hypothetical protein [Jannaschia seohaensis]PWJ22104.1 hypothetical protein BCF38_101513 [Jannaschia seohaensis]SSA38382.1 hypothetical protein SAMN05421539_101513 [Jannaschia seohaensis]
MSKDWIIEVLGDLRGFATMNDLPVTAEQLEEAIVVAIAEVSQQPGARMRTEGHGAEAGRCAGGPR